MFSAGDRNKPWVCPYTLRMAPDEPQPAAAAAEDIIHALGRLLGDPQPDFSDGIVEFCVLRGLHQEVGDEEFDRALQASMEQFRDDLPRFAWIAELPIDTVMGLVRQLQGSSDLPLSWIALESGIEFLVSDETQVRSLAGRRYKYPLSQTMTFKERNFRVLVGPASPALLLRLLTSFDEQSLTNLDARDRWFDATRLYTWLRMRESAHDVSPSDENHRTAALRLLREAGSEAAISLRIQHDDIVSMTDLLDAATAFRTSAAYQSNLVYVPLDEFGPFIRSRQPYFLRGLEEDARDAAEHNIFRVPGDSIRSFRYPISAEHAERYLRGVGAPDAFSAYLSYYHLIEFRFGDAWIQFCRKRLEDSGHTWQIQSTDVRAVSDATERTLGARAGSLRFSEREALKKLVSQSVDLNRIRHEMQSLLDGALQHFQNSTPSFVSTSTVNFSTRVNPAVFANIANRIYDVRCAIVHSKEGEARYTPFLHDIELAREIPLVRLVAEQLTFG